MLISFTLPAQEKTIPRYSFNIGLGAEKVGIPFRKMFDLPVNSAYHIGIQRRWSLEPGKSGYQSLDMYFFSNYSAGLGNNIQTSCGSKFYLIKNLFISPFGGIGIIHLFRPKDSYFLEDGIYKLYNDKGIIRPEAHIGMKVGHSAKKIDIFGSYQASVMYGYGKGVKLLPRTFLIIGMRYSIK